MHKSIAELLQPHAYSFVSPSTHEAAKAGREGRPSKAQVHVPRMWLRKLGCNVKTAFFRTAPRSWPCGLRTYTVRKQRVGRKGKEGVRNKPGRPRGPPPKSPLRTGPLMRALVLRVGLLGHLPGDGAVGNGQAYRHALHAAGRLALFHGGWGKGGGWGGRLGLGGRRFLCG